MTRNCRARCWILLMLFTRGETEDERLLFSVNVLCPRTQAGLWQVAILPCLPLSSPCLPTSALIWLLRVLYRRSSLTVYTSFLKHTPRATSLILPIRAKRGVRCCLRVLRVFFCVPLFLSDRSWNPLGCPCSRCGLQRSHDVRALWRLLGREAVWKLSRVLEGIDDPAESWGPVPCPLAKL